MDAIEFDVTKQLDQLSKLAKDMPFIISRAMNDVAFKHGRKDFSKDMNKNLDVKSKKFGSEKAMRIEKSDKKNFEVTIYHFLEQLGLQESGGVELPKGKKLAIPIRKNLATYAGIPKNKIIPKALRIESLMSKAPKDKSDAAFKVRGVKPFILRSGVFIRVDGAIRMLYVFRDKATHTKKLLKFQRTIERTYNIKLEKYINKHYLKVLGGR